MKFDLLKIGGGYHPVMWVQINGEEVLALIDTGANVSLFCREDDLGSVLSVGDSHHKLTDKHHYPNHSDKRIRVIIGSDILLREGALIDYQNYEITFHS